MKKTFDNLFAITHYRSQMKTRQKKTCRINQPRKSCRPTTIYISPEVFTKVKRMADSENRAVSRQIEHMLIRCVALGIGLSPAA